MDNRLVIGGIVAGAPETRYTPAGIPITRFRLRHQSVQTEAGIARKASCSIAVIASGEALRHAAAALGEGTKARVSGFVARSDHRTGSDRLVLHAQRIEVVDGT